MDWINTYAYLILLHHQGRTRFFFQVSWIFLSYFCFNQQQKSSSTEHVTLHQYFKTPILSLTLQLSLSTDLTFFARFCCHSIQIIFTCDLPVRTCVWVENSKARTPFEELSWILNKLFQKPYSHTHIYRHQTIPQGLFLCGSKLVAGFS